jgi:hypothetical protein
MPAEASYANGAFGALVTECDREGDKPRYECGAKESQGRQKKKMEQLK